MLQEILFRVHSAILKKCDKILHWRFNMLDNSFNQNPSPS